jgi:hypothetical protein
MEIAGARCQCTVPVHGATARCQRTVPAHGAGDRYRHAGRRMGKVPVTPSSGLKCLQPPIVKASRDSYDS